MLFPPSLLRPLLRPLLRLYTTAPVPPPSALLTTLKASLKASLKARTPQRTSTLKSLLSDLIYASHSPSPAPESRVVLRSIAAREDAILSFRAANPVREDLVKQYEEEIGVLREFVVEKEGGAGMERGELDALVKEVMGELGVALVEGKVGGKDLGRVVKRVLEKAEGKAQGNEVAQAVRRVGSS